MSQRVVLRDVIDDATLLPEGAVGIDAGLTLTKTARRSGDSVELVACETAALLERSQGRIEGSDGSTGVTGARGDRIPDAAGVIRVQEIEAAARGAIALIGDGAPSAFILALMGTGTAFAAVRDGSVSHLGGTPMGGGSFSGIARRIDASLTYDAMIERAAKGDRHNSDLMVSDAYPDGIGRIGADLTAAHLSKEGGSLDDVLAGLLNMHGENIAQIAAGRGLTVGIKRIVLAGGFVHRNDGLVTSMTAMARLFGVGVDVTPHAGFAGAIGAALMAGRT